MRSQAGAFLADFPLHADQRGEDEPDSVYGSGTASLFERTIATEVTGRTRHSMEEDGAARRAVGPTAVRPSLADHLGVIRAIRRSGPAA